MNEEVAVKASQGIVVKLPVAILAKLVASGESQADGIEQLENLDSEWAIVERIKRSSRDSDGPDFYARSLKLESREELVQHLERSYVNPYVETVAVLKNGSPRNMKIKVNVQFR